MEEEEDEARKIKSIGTRLVNLGVRACRNRHSADMGIGASILSFISNNCVFLITINHPSTTLFEN